MKKNEELDDIEIISLDLEKVMKNIPNFSSQKLCEMIVCDRYFNIDKQSSIHCMKELSKRRENGEILDFENIIENSYNELPKLDFNLLDLRTVLKQIAKK